METDKKKIEAEEGTYLLGTRHILCTGSKPKEPLRRPGLEMGIFSIAFKLAYTPDMLPQEAIVTAISVQEY